MAFASYYFFPWLSTTGNTFDGTQVLDPDLLERLNLPEFQADSYAQAIAETPVHKGEAKGLSMRKTCAVLRDSELRHKAIREAKVFHPQQGKGFLCEVAAMLCHQQPGRTPTAPSGHRA